MSSTFPEILVTATDHERLTGLLASVPATDPVLPLLQEELDRAEIVEQTEVPPDVVTMNSRVVIEEVDTGEQRAVTLVYPGHADVETGRLSILAPVGAALLGLRAGQSIDWPLPGGRRKRVNSTAGPSRGLMG